MGLTYIWVGLGYVIAGAGYYQDPNTNNILAIGCVFIGTGFMAMGLLSSI